MIKAIETKYRGYRFRSRLEARWAVFFDHIGLDWLYEHEGYSVNGRPYLPDFYIPSMGIVVEIKPQYDPSLDITHLRGLAQRELPVCLFYGLPWQWCGLIMCYDTSDSGGGFCADDGFRCLWGKGHDGAQLWASAGDGRYLCTDNWKSIPGVVDVSHDAFNEFSSFVLSGTVDYQDVRDAIDAAKSARFEHGENGGVQ